MQAGRFEFAMCGFFLQLRGPPGEGGGRLRVKRARFGKLAFFQQNGLNGASFGQKNVI